MNRYNFPLFRVPRVRTRYAFTTNRTTHVCSVCSIRLSNYVMICETSKCFQFLLQYRKLTLEVRCEFRTRRRVLYLIVPRLPRYTRLLSNKMVDEEDTLKDSSSGRLVTIRPTYSTFVEKIKLMCAGSSFQCSMFCGGRECKYENHSQWAEDHQAIPGIFSHW